MIDTIKEPCREVLLFKRGKFGPFFNLSKTKTEALPKRDALAPR